MQNTAVEIFKILKTKERANEFLVFSDILKSFEHYVGEVDYNEVFKEKFGQAVPDWLNHVLEKLPGLNDKNFNKSEVSGIIENVVNMVNNSLVVKIEMPFKPSLDFIDRLMILLGGYFVNSDTADREILIDVDVKDMNEPGAFIYLDGKFLDLTFKNQVVNYLMSEDVINRYL